MTEMSEWWDSHPKMLDAIKDVYKAGLADGMAMSLSLLLGRETDGGAPYTGRLNASAQNWAMDSLAAINSMKEAE
jgi:hypothetical protein